MVLVLWVVGIVWACAVALALWLRAVPIREGEEDLLARALYRVIRLYARIVHRTRYAGLEHAREAERWAREGKPVIVAPNHTSGIDPLLVQAALRFEPRWMMAADMRAESLDWLWEAARIIFVDRDAGDAASLRTALRHLKRGKSLGVFPEGHIERPPGVVLPYRAGVGVMAKRTGALVLPVVIEGTPQVDPAWASIKMCSASRVRFLAPVSYADSELDAQGVAGDLHRRVVEATGWPASERTPVVTNGHRIMIDLEGRYYEGATGERLSDDEVRAIIDAMEDS